MHSLRTSLLFRTALLLTATLSIAAVTLFVLMRASLLSQFDSALLLEAQVLASHAEHNGDAIVLELDDREAPYYATAESPCYFELWTNNGQVKAKSQSLKDRDLEQPIDLTEVPVHLATMLPSGRPARQVAFRFIPRVDEDVSELVTAEVLSIALARDTTQLDAILDTLIGSLLLVAVGTVLGSIVILGRLVRVGLLPLNSLASSIARVGIADLSERVQINDAPIEMAAVVHRLNELLGRLDSARTREKSFTADVAHELRTPLTALQTSLEVCVSKAREPQYYQEVIERCLQVTGGLHSMVESLLVLARADANQLVVAIESVEIDSLIRGCWSPLAEIAQGKMLNVQWVGDFTTIVETDRYKVQLVLKNIFENAVAYCEQSGWVHITVVVHSAYLEVTIANSGCALRESDVAHVCDRFWRGDVSRANTGMHCGLGLSLCQKVMDVLGGSIEVQVKNGIFTVMAVFPFTTTNML